MVTIPNTITQQSQSHQSESTFQLALASTAQTNSFTAIRDGLKTTIAKPVTIQQQQLQQNFNKMQGIVFANAIQLQAAKLQRQSTTQQKQQPNRSKTTATTTTQPLAARTIQRAHKIQLPQALPPQIVVRRQSGEM